MTEILMSYGHIDKESMVESIRLNSENINPDYVWDHKAIEFDNITSKSVVVEVGAYTGSWIYRLAKKYNPKLYVFEPQPWCCLILEELLKEYKAKIFNYALGETTGMMAVDKFETDGCYFDATKSGSTMLAVKEIGEAFEENNIKRIDLMHINIEGGEFTLIPYMFQSGIFPKILMFATHEWDKVAPLMKIVKKYYKNIWDYGTNLSAWQLKEKKK